MLFLGVGIILLVMKYFEIAPVAGWSWLLVLSPFVIAILWWEVVVPLLGLERRHKVDEHEKRKQDRIRKQLEK